ncbi:MAG TPA: hypothetical protein VKD72_05155 [Gemmataceae bacterium]|nr:hypothetical protein [Gemmataceae bacterium]
MFTRCTGRLPRLPLPLFLAWLWLLADAAADPARRPPPPSREADMQRFLDLLTVHDDGVLALAARPELAERLKLSERQRRLIQEAVTRWVAAKLDQWQAENKEHVAMRESKDDERDPQRIQQWNSIAQKARTEAHRLSAEANRLRKVAREQVEDLLTEGQKALFQELRPVALKERWRVTLPDYYGVAAFSPDGKWLATGSGGQVTLYPMPQGEPARKLPMPGEGANAKSGPHALAFSRDGKTLAAAWIDGRYGCTPEMVHWDLGRRAVTTRFPLREFNRTRFSLLFAVSPDLHRYAVAGDTPGVVSIRNGATGAEVAVLRGYSPSERVSGVEDESQPWDNIDCAFAPDGKTFAASFAWRDFHLPFTPEQLGDKRHHPPDNRIKLWDTGTWKERRTIAQAGPAFSSGLAFTPDSALLAGSHSHHRSTLQADNYSHLRLWDAATGRERLALPVPKRFHWQSATGKDLVCVGAPGGEVMVWDRESKLERAFQHPLYSDSPSLTTVLSAALSPDGRALALVAVRETGLPEKRSTLVLLSIPPPRSKAPR